MNELLQLLLPTRLLQPLLKPIVRLFLGLIAIPIFRLFVRRVVRVEDLDDELEKDLELWFRDPGRRTRKGSRIVVSRSTAAAHCDRKHGIDYVWLGSA